MMNTPDREQIIVSESARDELKKMMQDAGQKKPRIFLAGFG